MIDEVLKVMLITAFVLLVLCALCILINEFCECIRSDEEEWPANYEESSVSTIAEPQLRYRIINPNNDIQSGHTANQQNRLYYQNPRAAARYLITIRYDLRE